ncbi:MAG: hypothetical protein M9951_08885 [Burkholderiaceae bacterium]|nr:hypothetical protein [Burkholderiaceae bacterium]
MQHRSPTWLVVTALGILLFFYGIVFDPGFDVFGTVSYVLTIRAGVLLVIVGIVWGLVRVVRAPRQALSSGTRTGLVAAVGVWDGRTGRFMTEPSMSAGPAVNIDGTPMLPSGVDVMGKAYGDDGHRHDAGGMSFDCHHHDGSGSSPW